MMLEKIITRLVEYQISRGILEEKDKRLYQYGYQVLAEYAANLLTAVLIAAVFHAYGIVLIFTLSFMLVRSYAGGYHAGTGLGCLILSALMQIAVILMVRALGSAEFMNPEIFGTEVIMVFYIWNRIPVPVKNKPMSESERLHFRKKARILYILELLIEIIFLAAHRTEWAMAVLSAHLMVFFLVFFSEVEKWKN